MLKNFCVTLCATVLTSANIVLISSVTIKPAYSQNNSSINYFRQGYQRAYVGWSNFNYQEKEIDRRITAVLTSIGRLSIPVTDQNVVWMMQQTGANKNLYTAGFIAGRMSVFAEVTNTLDQTDSMLCSIGRQFNISAGKTFC